MSVLWLNGALVPAEHAVVPALDRGVLWGYGLFETMRAYGGRVWGLADHYARLRAGAEHIGVSVPTEAEVAEALDAVLSANDLLDAGVRVTITAGAGPVDPQAEIDGPPSVIVTAWPVGDYAELYRDGASFITLPGGGRPLSGLKTTSYAASVAGRLLARRSGADDVLFLGHDGSVLEATASNVFVVRGEVLTTPPLSDPLLPGVTRRHVMAVAEQAGFAAEEAHVSLDDLFAADEVVLTSSMREVYPARSVDGRALARTDAAERLRAAYRAAVLRSL